MSNLIFFGTPDFATSCLQAVHEFCQNAGHQLVGVVCQPDKPSERGHRLHEPAVKQLAKKLNLPVWQPAKIMPDFIEWFKEQSIDLAVVVAYGKILPKELLSASRLGFVNVHGSLLPRWRGAAPIQRAIEAGDTETGICIMNLVPEMDAGEIYLRARTPIGPQETSGDLLERLAPLGAQALIQALPGILNQTLHKQTQPEIGVTYAPKVKKEEALINWSKSAQEIINHVRAMQPWPGSYAHYHGKKLRLFGATPSPHPLPKGEGEKPGQIIEAADKLIVSTGQGLVSFIEAQLEGRRRMSIRDLLNGFPMQAGELLC